MRNSSLADKTRSVADAAHPWGFADIRGSLTFAIASVAYRAISLAASIGLRRVIPPEQFGVWNLVQVVADFVGKFDAGSSAAVARELPLARGRGHPGDVVALQSSALVLAAAQGLLLAASVIVYAGLVGIDDGFGNEAFVYVAASAMVLFSAFSTVAQSIVQGHGRFEAAGYLIVMLGITNTVSTFVGGMLGGAVGLVWGGVVAAATSAAIVWLFLARLDIPVSLARATSAAARRILRYGVPLRFADYPSTVLFSIDSLAVAVLYGRTELAIYATARLFSAVGHEIGTRLTAPVRNTWLVKFGADPDGDAIPMGIWRLLQTQAMFTMPSIALTTYLGAQVLVTLATPEYVSALPILQVLLLSWVFLPQGYGLRDLWIARGNFRAMFVSGAGGLAIFVVALSYLRMTRSTTEPKLVATAFVFSMVAYATTVVAFIGSEIWDRRRTLHVCLLMFSSAALMFVMLRLATLPVGWQADPWKPLLLACSRGALALVILISCGATISWLGRTGADE